jgi:hypothetical protein
LRAHVEVEQTAPHEFRVRVVEGQTHTRHQVTLSTAEYERLSSKKVAPAELVRRAFEFLLAREPKEEILAKFDLAVIGKYFGEFEQTLKRSLDEL